MVNDPSYVAASQPTTGGYPATIQRSRAEDEDPSMLLFTTMIDTIKGQTKMMESFSQQQNMMMQPTIPVFDGEPNKYRLFKMQFQNLYHRRCPDDATRLSFLTGLLSEKVIKKVQDSVDRPESSYDHLWQRLDAEFGHISIEA